MTCFTDFGPSDSYISFWAEKDQNMSFSTEMRFICYILIRVNYQ